MSAVNQTPFGLRPNKAPLCRGVRGPSLDNQILVDKAAKTLILASDISFLRTVVLGARCDGYHLLQNPVSTMIGEGLFILAMTLQERASEINPVAKRIKPGVLDVPKSKHNVIVSQNSNLGGGQQ